MNRDLCRLIRQSYGMTTFEFAEKIGVSLSSYTNYETGYTTSSDLVPSRVLERIPRGVIIEAEKLLRLTSSIKADKAI